MLTHDFSDPLKEAMADVVGNIIRAEINLALSSQNEQLSKLLKEAGGSNEDQENSKVD